MTELPSGTVTFLFTDIEGSTRLLEEHGDRYAELLERHRQVIRAACSRRGGVEVDTQGDAFFVAFARAADAVAAAQEAQRKLQLPVRMAIHTGEPQLSGGGYVGVDLHRGARICAAGHGGQVLLSQATHDLVDTDVVDLGLHRLKDVGEHRLYQLGEREFPALRSLNQTNLPLRSEPLLGRKNELADVLGLLRLPNARLVTITGPGGIGKTTCAVAAAAETIEDFTEGIWFVDLAALRDPELVLPTIASAIGARGELTDYLVGKELLLVLDNFEQVVDAAAQLGALLERAPTLCVLVTSREPLHLRGERTYPLRPLTESPAVELFRQRAEAVDPSFEATYEQLAELCSRLDNLPLALELAAARTRALTVSQLLDRLEERLPLLSARQRDLPERQRTLRATIEWSYDLLAPVEQELFRRVSVFAGGFDLDAAERVAHADLDTLESLVEKSLLRQDGERLTMLETVREFAAERLEEGGEQPSLHERHAAHFVALAESQRDRLAGPDAATALERIAAAYDNLRAALEWLNRTDGVQQLRLAAALWRFWLVRAGLLEGRWWLELALARPVDGEPALRAEAAYGLGAILATKGDLRAADEALNASIAHARAAGETAAATRALIGLANVASELGELERAAAVLEEAVAAARLEGDWDVALAAMGERATVALMRGDYQLARELAEETLGLEPADAAGNAVTLATLGHATAGEGNAVSAKEWLAESLRLAQRLEYLDVIAFVFDGLARVAALEGSFERAAILFGAADGLRDRFGIAPGSGGKLAQRDREAVEQRLSEGDFAAAFERGRALELDEAAAFALAH